MKMIGLMFSQQLYVGEHACAKFSCLSLKNVCESSMFLFMSRSQCEISSVNMTDAMLHQVSVYVYVICKMC